MQKSMGIKKCSTALSGRICALTIQVERQIVSWVMSVRGGDRDARPQTILRFANVDGGRTASSRHKRA